MTSVILEVQQAVYDKLQNDTYLDSLVTGIFGDDVPQEQPFPFIQITSGREMHFNTFDRKGKEIAFDINVYSQYQGFKECYEIHSRVTSLLDYSQLSIENHSLVYIRFDEVSALRMEDRITRLIRADYKIIAQQGL